MNATLSNDLQKEYTIRFSKIAAYRDSVWKLLIERFLQRRVGTNKDILDLGSGWGEFINNIQAQKKYAMDLNPDAENRVSPSVHFIQQDCSQRWALPDECLDVVFTSNFFEHLPSKQCLLDTLRQAHRCLKPSGTIICLGPNIKYVGQAYWDFFDHYLQLSHLSLVEGLKMVDFQISSVIPRFIPYTMADGKRPPLFSVQIYLSLPLIWPLFGKQFLVSAKK